MQGYLRENRARLVASALTILKAFHVAKQPSQNLPPWGGFYHWSKQIREAIVWAGADDPCLTREAVAEDDYEIESATIVIDQLHHEFKEEEFTINEVVLRTQIREVGSTGKDGAYLHADLRNALLAVAENKGAVCPKRLSWWCRNVRGRFIGELRLIKTSHDGAKRPKWKIKIKDAGKVQNIGGHGD